MHKEFWDAMMVIAEVEVQEAVKQDELDWARLRGEPIPAKYTIKEAGLHEAVDSDVQMMLAGMPCCSRTTLMKYSQNIIYQFMIYQKTYLCIYIYTYSIQASCYPCSMGRQHPKARELPQPERNFTHRLDLGMCVP